jgi:hypothetical protein
MQRSTPRANQKLPHHHPTDPWPHMQRNTTATNQATPHGLHMDPMAHQRGKTKGNSPSTHLGHLWTHLSVSRSHGGAKSGALGSADPVGAPLTLCFHVFGPRFPHMLIVLAVAWELLRITTLGGYKRRGRAPLLHTPRFAPILTRRSPAVVVA